MSGLSRSPSDGVIGPDSVTDGVVARFDGTSGKVLKDDGLIVNADIKAAAAIAHSKLAGTASTTQARVTLSKRVASPVASEEFFIGLVPENATMVEVYGATDAGTVDFNVEERAFGGAFSAGTDKLTADLQATTAGARSTTFSNAGIAARSWLIGTFSAVVTATDFVCAATYDIDG